MPSSRGDSSKIEAIALFFIFLLGIIRDLAETPKDDWWAGALTPIWMA
jgi:hypothetical protein